MIPKNLFAPSPSDTRFPFRFSKRHNDIMINDDLSVLKAVVCNCLLLDDDKKNDAVPACAVIPVFLGY